MASLLHQPVPFAGCLLKGFFALMALLVGLRAFVIPYWEGWSEQREDLRNIHGVAQMVAYINHERRFGNTLDIHEVMAIGAQQHLRWRGGKDERNWSDIECREVPKEKRVGELAKVDYYLVVKGSHIGMLGDGRFIFSPFDLDAPNLGSPGYLLRLP